ncbi:MAG: DUF6609 family protein [Ethanoligenens sp.]
MKQSKSLYLSRRCCGLWLVLIAAVILLSMVTGGRYYLNPVIFGIGYATSLILSLLNPAVRRRLAYGPMSAFQKRMSRVALLVMFTLMSVFGGPYFSTMNWRMIWLGALLATGLHFFVFYFVHGLPMLPLGLLCTLVAAVGYLLPGVPFYAVSIADVLIKAGFGVWLLLERDPNFEAITNMGGIDGEG